MSRLLIGWKFIILFQVVVAYDDDVLVSTAVKIIIITKPSQPADGINNW